MRKLDKEINDSPKIFLLKFSRFFIFGAIAALERLLIVDGVSAFSCIALTYGGFILYERFIPPHFFYYFLTKVNHFEWEQDDENSGR